MIKAIFLLFTAYLLLPIHNFWQKKKVTGSAEVSANKPPILWAVDCNPNGKLYAVGGDDGVLKVYDTKGFKLVKTYKLPTAIQCLEWNKQGDVLAIALDDSPVQLLRIETGKFQKLQGSGGSRALAWNSDGELLAVGDYDGQLQIWNKKGLLIKSIKKENTKTYLSVDWHPTKNIILTGGDKIRLFDTAGNLLKTINHRIEETIILTVRWHPGGTFFATGDYGHKEQGIESLLQFWQQDGTLIKTLPGSKAEYRNIRWNKKGTLLATASDALRLWSTEGEIVYTGKSADLLWGMDWCKGDKNVITGSEKGIIKLWNDKAGLMKNMQ